MIWLRRPKQARTTPRTNYPSFCRTECDVPRHQTGSDLRQPDPARHRQTKPGCMACSRSVVRIPLAPEFFVSLFDGKMPNYGHRVMA